MVRALGKCGLTSLALGLAIRVSGCDEQLLVSPLNPLSLIQLLLTPFGLLAARITLGTLQAAHEALDLTSGVDDALLARVERVALVAQVNPQVRLGRPCRPGIAAGADHGRFLIIRMNASLHDC